MVDYSGTLFSVLPPPFVKRLGKPPGTKGGTLKKKRTSVCAGLWCSLVVTPNEESTCAILLLFESKKGHFPWVVQICPCPMWPSTFNSFDGNGASATGWSLLDGASPTTEGTAVATQPIDQRAAQKTHELTAERGAAPPQLAFPQHQMGHPQMAYPQMAYQQMSYPMPVCGGAGYRCLCERPHS